MSKRMLRFAHALPWPALGGGALACSAVVVAMYGLPASPLGRWPGLGGLALCTGAAFILDDPARSTVAATPMTLARWRLLRIALALPLLLGVWSASLWAMTT
ncbi:MAG: hypothetical protein LC777_11015, partial [Actinobacteria bacterium]|nr:hypothetical protein [Actinomycetota bacterium]